MLSTLNNYRVKYLRWLYGPITDGIREYKIRRHRNADCQMIANLKPGINRVFYLGITQQPNLEIWDSITVSRNG